MNTPDMIRARVEAALTGLPRIDSEVLDALDDEGAAAVDIDAVGRRLEQAHQILVDALESVEKG